MNISIPSQIQMTAYYFLFYTILIPYTGEQINMLISLVGSLAFYGVSKLMRIKRKGSIASIPTKKSSISQISDLNLFGRSDKILELDAGVNNMEMIS